MQAVELTSKLSLDKDRKILKAVKNYLEVLTEDTQYHVHNIEIFFYGFEFWGHAPDYLVSRLLVSQKNRYV